MCTQLPHVSCTCVFVERAYAPKIKGGLKTLCADAFVLSAKQISSTQQRLNFSCFRSLSQCTYREDTVFSLQAKYSCTNVKFCDMDQSCSLLVRACCVLPREYASILSALHNIFVSTTKNRSQMRAGCESWLSPGPNPDCPQLRQAFANLKSLTRYVVTRVD